VLTFQDDQVGTRLWRLVADTELSQDLAEPSRHLSFGHASTRVN